VSGELLLEVRTEEIPARMLPGAAKELATRLFEGLMARAVPPVEVAAGFTPRRLWLTMSGLPEREADRHVVEVGPPASVAFDAEGRPTAAALGFARKFGVEAGALLRVDLTKDKDFLLKGETVSGAAAKGERLVLRRTIAGEAMGAILAEAIPTLLGSLSWAKTMRWGSGTGPWVRPVHGIVALLDGEVVPFELFDVASGRTSAGHPTLSPDPFEIADAGDWRARLAACGIVLAVEDRQASLRAEMERRAAAAGGSLVDDPELLAKLAAICEIPGVMEGKLDDALLALPREVLTTSLRDHQSALTVEREGRLLPLFLTVMDRPDDPAGRVRAGNEWVVAARLADARFFWEKDRSTRLEDRIPALDELGFHQKLGSYGAKRSRLIALAEAVAPKDSREGLATAASLAKSDLTTDMVREFTSLQGVMGGIYAREEGRPEEVWQAIYDQYLPASTDDALPRGRTGRLLALVDRIDTLVGFFGLGLIPTGSRDPFALRRAAQSALRILLEGGTALSLPSLVLASVRTYEGVLEQRGEEVWDVLRPFLEDRMRFLFELQGFAYDEVEAGLKRPGEDLSDLVALRARVAALHEKREDKDFLSVVLAAKRIANITKDQPQSELDAVVLELPAERNLAGVAELLEKEIAAALEAADFAAGLSAVARLAPSLEAFFEEVLVMDEDEGKRASRIALLRSIGGSIARLADLSELVVDKSDYR